MSNPGAPQHTRAALSRRGFLGAGGALALGALIAACGGDGGDKSSSGGGSWSFTDDRGEKIRLDARPGRVVAYVAAAAALYDFGVDEQLVGVFGPTKLKDGSPDPQAGDLPVDRLEIIGNAFGEFNIEKYAALRPELLVSNMFVDDELFYVPPESKDKIYGLAPSVAISAGSVPLPKPIERTAELAAALGADVKSDKVTADRRRFEKAAERVRAAAEEKRGLKVLAASASPDLFYASSPDKNTDLIYLKELGVDIVVPEKLDQAGYFENLSWENAGKYKADLILLDSRTQALQPKDLGDKPTWKELPAVKAGQVVPWQPEPRFSYAGCAPILEEFAAALQSAKKAG
ncbi:iron complex transport system substrate-binding protein [Actinomadura hallensis]|uniref:Iron complex transport system substrate-binding protein n=1 Tax=Actinomadura hallensis TaxID=337895 RepID=A0A543II42_9ACTN|nr:ABC transporter substrate-binding protein [Actinomadura hallensis]TQM70245.1 iron complex transport system substrate-binding protein [Actinomadura hallensis]HLV74656.1 ABC transporter substrate-binding protein [Vulgatibacteraceae bacterium]